MEAVVAADSNNNSDKYSLRPRSLKKRAETELRRQQALQQQQLHLQQKTLLQQPAQQQAASLALHGGADLPPHQAACRVAVPELSARGGGGGGAGAARATRPKQKPAPLSKYRRKTANARERSRMREINVAFETLRRAVPHTAAPACTSEKLTKITTLRLAMKYISALSQAVRDNEELVLEAPDPVPYSSSLFSQPNSPVSSPLLPTFDHLRGCGSASSNSSLSAHGFGDPDFADHSLLAADFADFPEPTLGMAGIADLVDPCLTAVALTSDDFYDNTFVSEFS